MDYVKLDENSGPGHTSHVRSEECRFLSTMRVSRLATIMSRMTLQKPQPLSPALHDFWYLISQAPLFW